MLLNVKRTTGIRANWHTAAKTGRTGGGQTAQSGQTPAGFEHPVITGRPDLHAGVVYVMTNDAAANAVIALRRRNDGTLALLASYPTGGRGTGPTEVSPATPQDGVDPLASQGSLTLSRCGRFLFAVNAGSNEVSSFRVAADGRLDLADVTPSGGAQPNSVDAFDGLVYVSNVGNAANGFASNVTGFHLRHDGTLQRIPGSTRSLSTPNAQPARVLFSPEGSLLVVSELTTNRVSLFRVQRDGTLARPTVNPSSGPAPFGSVFLSTGRLLVAEASGALSSYAVTLDGTLFVISGSVPSTQRATCWVVTSRDERFAYTSNTDSGTISLYSVAENAALALLVPVAARPSGPAPRPIDPGVSRDGRNFYVLDGGQGAVDAYRIERGGRLTHLQTLTNIGLPRLGSQGLAVI